MATVLPTSTNFEMGRVFGRTFEVIGRNIALYLALAVVLVGLPTLVIQLLVPATENQAAFRQALLQGGFGRWLAMLGLAGFVGTIFRYFLQATLVRATI